ncbi:hypothetical protein Fcan01_16276 [Folsomia candida]|uniref:Uncharacterized protein n=1 Tax=Folsomia candida TaxID=158441 RepID=A0A226DVA3_FOLCA|nr:hypothetical protein Fcan01_16276 [Folsomia candida]
MGFNFNRFVQQNLKTLKLCFIFQIINHVSGASHVENGLTRIPFTNLDLYIDIFQPCVVHLINYHYNHIKSSSTPVILSRHEPVQYNSGSWAGGLGDVEFQFFLAINGSTPFQYQETGASHSEMAGKPSFPIIFKTQRKNWNCFTRFYLLPNSTYWDYPKLKEETFATYGKTNQYVLNSYPRNGYQILVKLMDADNLESAWNLKMNYFLDMLDLIVLNSKIISAKTDPLENRIAVIGLLLCCRYCNPSRRILVKFDDDSLVPSLTSLNYEIESKFSRIQKQTTINIHMPFGTYKPKLPKIVPVLKDERLSDITASEYIAIPGRATMSDFILSILLRDVNASAQYTREWGNEIGNAVGPLMDTASTEDYKISSLETKIVTAGVVLGSMVLTNAFRGDNVKNIVAATSSKPFLYFGQVFEKSYKIYSELIDISFPFPHRDSEFGALQAGTLGPTTTFASDISVKRYDAVLSKLRDRGAKAGPFPGKIENGMGNLI